MLNNLVASSLLRVSLLEFLLELLEPETFPELLGPLELLPLELLLEFPLPLPPLLLLEDLASLIIILRIWLKLE